ncbi:MAG TPA: methionine synthase, partial [Roseovarius sp.]|nr:methionine synthase [Roseovarius sp.]
IIGGCCGTMGDHLRLMRAALEERPMGPRPTPEQITDKIGPFSSPSDGTGEDAAQPRRTRRRRA